MPLEVGKDYKTVCLPENRRGLDRRKVAVSSGQFDDIAPVHAVADPDGTAEVLFRETVFRCGLQAVRPGSPSPGIENGCVKHEGPDAGFPQPPDDRARVPRVQEVSVSPLPPVEFDSHTLAGGKGR